MADNILDTLAAIQAQQIGGVPAVRQPVAAVPGAAAPTTGVPAPTSPLDTGSNKPVLGLDPAQFSSIVGGIAAALAPPNTWQARLGKFAQTLGKGKQVGRRLGSQVKGAELKDVTPAAGGTPTTAAPTAAPLKSKLEEEIDLSTTLI